MLPGAASKHWSGLIKDYYAKRAILIQQQALSNAASKTPLDQAAVARIKAEHAYEFTTATNSYPTEPLGDFIGVSEAMYDNAFPTLYLLHRLHVWIASGEEWESMPAASTHAVALGLPSMRHSTPVLAKAVQNSSLLCFFDIILSPRECLVQLEASFAVDLTGMHTAAAGYVIHLCKRSCKCAHRLMWLGAGSDSDIDIHGSRSP